MVPGIPLRTKDSDVLIRQRTQNRRALIEAHNRGQMGLSYMSRIRAEEIPDMETMRLYPAEGKMPVDAEGLLVMLHGCGVDVSQSSSMRKWIRLFGEQETSKKNMMWTQKHILHYQNYTRLAVEAIDLPGHGVGPLLDRFQTLEQVAHWLGTYLKQRKAEVAGKPLFVMTRSSSAIFPAAVNSTYPEVIAQEIAAARDNVMRGVYGAVNEAGIVWIGQMLHQADWGHAEDFCGIPTLILTADKDPEVVEKAREHFQAMAERLPNVEYHEFNAEAHDFLSCEDKAGRDEALRGLQLIHSMCKRVVRHPRSAPMRKGWVRPAPSPLAATAGREPLASVRTTLGTPSPRKAH
jgi:hypothetical protein